MKIEEVWEAFNEDFWSKSCCSGPCINTRDTDWDFLEGAEALYKFIQEKGEDHNE
jgi:hypothetical protein